ncbi:metallophosphoesterase [Leptospira koniambonensis]|uniref:metallophosphoesterase n=1 Tax=Leptospira koniambonensis TaxID=2484950 RepID=UPI003EBAA76F
MKIQFVSDLHLEFPENRSYLKVNQIIPNGDILILAGDIVPDKYKKKVESFYKNWRGQFKYIISISGNHEYYSGEVLYAYPEYRKQLADNHFKLNNGVLIIENIRFICTTLWTQIPVYLRSFIESRINDYRYIKYSKKESDPRLLNIEDTNMFHKLSLSFLELELSKEFKGKTVVVTHHLPSFEFLTEIDNQTDVRHYCASDLNKLIKRYEIDYWIFGHYHKSIDTTIFGTRFLSNPLGYMDENQKNVFSSSNFIEI